jgi:hypothetical protein
LNITGSGTPEKSHSAYSCEVAGGSSLVEPWYDMSSVVAARFPATGTRRPGQPSCAATSMLADEACAIVAPRKTSGIHDPENAPPVRVVAVMPVIVSRCEVTCTRPVVVPFTRVESIDRSVVGVEVLKGPQRPPGRAPGYQQRVRRGPALARSAAASEDHRGW